MKYAYSTLSIFSVVGGLLLLLLYGINAAISAFILAAVLAVAAELVELAASLNTKQNDQDGD